jgi:dolichol-phosphate mannosyltransferase
MTDILNSHVDDSHVVIVSADEDPINVPEAAARENVSSPKLTVIVPTRNEAESVQELLRQLAPELTGIPAEILFVDDSDDGTAEELTRLAPDCAVDLRVLHRRAAERSGGLGGAVLAGLRVARGEWVMVMDADLQHPPASAVAMSQAAMRQDVDIVIGTRYAGAGARDGLNGAGRTMTSSIATRVSKTFFPRLLATVSDPMSGLFVLRRSAVDLDRLRPDGFKILMEILVRHPSARVGEVAYRFAPRLAGTSKASAKEGFTFVRLLGRLRSDVLVKQLRRRPSTKPEQARQGLRALGFALVGASGVAVNTGVLWFVYHVLGVHALLAAIVATQASTTWNFLLVDLLVYRQPKRGTRLGRGVRFYLMNNLLLLARLPVLALLISTGLDVLVANAFTLVMLFVVRFLVSDRVIYGSGPEGPSRDPVRMLVDLTASPAQAPAATKKRSNYLTYRYDVAGVVRIGSQIRLPELEFFRAQWVADDRIDIAVRVGDVGGRGPRRRAAMTQYADPVTLRYEEHLGRFGANFRVMLGDPITIEVGPLLARSPHVVYTNIIEALLRFVLVSRGKMLLHSACVELDGVGVMLSALTDTGKTATILRLLREHGGKFLSDDMTIVDTTGLALCFPKPLTISAHTLRAVQAEDLTKGEWRRLQFQSRLHSKGGRSLALALANWNVPIMGINALTQILVPPPKYSVDRLVPAKLGSSTRVEELFIIERGTPRLSDLSFDDTLRQMLINTDDAYGFPPFRYLAPAVRIGGLDYTQLRAKERDILAGFLGHVRSRALASDSFGWADEIPRLLAEERGTSTAVLDGGAAALEPATDSWPRWAPAPTPAAG